MLAVFFGISGAAAFGAADFLGGFAAKLLGSLRASWIAAACGLATISALYLVFGGNWSAESLLWGALSGFAGMFAIIFLYASLAIGPMSVLSPIGALVAAIVPVISDFLSGQQLSPLGYLAVLIALVAVWFVGFVPDPDAVRPRARGLLLAVAAGTCIGVFMILIDHAPDDAGMLPLIANRMVQTIGMSIAVAIASLVHLARKRGLLGGGRPARADIAVGDRGALDWRRALPFAVSCGVIDAVGNSLILYGLVIGNLSIVSVLAGLYPGATILLAALVLRERIARIQYLGLALAIVAAALLAIA